MTYKHILGGLLVLCVLSGITFGLVNADSQTRVFDNIGKPYVFVNTTVSSTTKLGYSLQVTNPIYSIYYKSNSNTAEPVRFEKGGYFFIYDISGSKLQWHEQPGFPSRTDTLGGGAPSNSQDTVISHSGSTVTYAGAFYNTNVTYTARSDGVKEYFTLGSLPSIKDYTYLEYTGNIKFNRSLQICANNRCYTPSGAQDDFNTTGKIEFRDSYNKTIFYLEPPVVIDSKGNSTNCIYYVRGSDAQMNFWLRIPTSWLRTATFPIVVDPSIHYNTSARYPTVATGNTPSGSGTVAWLTPTGIEDDGGTYAYIYCSSSCDHTSKDLKGSNYGFAIPSNAVISGIQLEMNKVASQQGANRAHDITVSLIKSDGSYTAANYASDLTIWPTVWTIRTYGGASDLWGETWTPADINDVDFGAILVARIQRLSGYTIQASVDYMRLTVYYELPMVSWLSFTGLNATTNTAVNFTWDVREDVDNCTLRINSTSGWINYTGIIPTQRDITQEYADTETCETTCAGTFPCGNMTDGNWSTVGAFPDTCDRSMQVNYIIPNGSDLSTSKWRIKNSGLGTFNLSLTPGCWPGSGGTLRLGLFIGAIGNEGLKCYDYSVSDYVILNTSISNIYEEEMLWNVTKANKSLVLVKGNYTPIYVTCYNGSVSTNSQNIWTYSNLTSIIINSAVNTTLTNNTQIFNITLADIGNCSLHFGNGTSFLNDSNQTNLIWTLSLNDSNHTGIYFECNISVNGILNKANSSTYWLNIDTLPPSVVWSTINFTTSSDPYILKWNTTELANCTLHLNGNHLNSTVSIEHNYTFNNYSNGNYTINTTCEDIYGNSALSSSGWVYINNSVTFVLPTQANATIVNLRNWYYINVSTTFTPEWCYLEWQSGTPSATNQTMTLGTKQAHINKTSSDGDFNYTIYCNSTYGGVVYSTEKRLITITNAPPDLAPPVMTGESPPNSTTYAYTYNGSSLLITVYTDEPVSTCRWSNVSGIPLSAMNDTFLILNGVSPSYKQRTNIILPGRGETDCWYIRCNDTLNNTQTSDYKLCYSVGTAPPITCPPGQSLCGDGVCRVDCGGGGGAQAPKILEYGTAQFSPRTIFDWRVFSYGFRWQRTITTSFPIYMCGFEKFQCAIVGDNTMTLTYPRNSTQLPNSPFVSVSETGFICPNENECYNYKAELQGVNLNWHIPIGNGNLPSLILTSPNGINLIPLGILLLGLFLANKYGYLKSFSSSKR